MGPVIEIPLTELVLDFVRVVGPCSSEQLRQRFSHKDLSYLFRAIRKLVGRGDLAYTLDWKVCIPEREL